MTILKRECYFGMRKLVEKDLPIPETQINTGKLSHTEETKEGFIKFERLDVHL